jgi:CHAT domain-containing protein
MQTVRHLLCGAIAFGFMPPGLPCQQWQLQDDYPKFAEAFRAAFLARDTEKIQALAAMRVPANEPFLVADSLLKGYREHRARAEGEDWLAAARRYAELVGAARSSARGVAALVEAWAAQDVAALAARTGFRQQVHALRQRFAQRDAAAVADAEPLLASPMPHETFSFWLAWDCAEFLEKERRLEEAAAMYARAADVAAAMAWTRYEGEALYRQAIWMRVRGEFSRTAAPLERVIAVAEADGDVRNVVRMRGNLATAYGFLGDRARWQELCEATLAAARERGEYGTVAQIRMDQADVEMAAGRPEAALQRSREAREALEILDRADKLGDPGYLAQVDAQLGTFLLRTGRIADGLARLELANQEFARDADEVGRHLDNLLDLANSWLLLQRPDLARPFLEEAVEKALKADSLDALARAQARLLDTQFGDAGAEGIRKLRDLVSDMQRRGAVDAALAQRLRIAELEHASERHDEAIATLDATIEEATARSKADLVLQARLLRCRALLAKQRFADASAEAEQARRAADAQTQPEAEATAATLLAEARFGLGDTAGAVEHAERAIAILHGLGRGLGEVAGLGLRRSARAAADIGLAALWKQQQDRPAPGIARRAFALLESSRALLLASGLEPRLGSAPEDAELAAAEGFARLRVRQCQRDVVTARGSTADTVSAVRALDAAFHAWQLATTRLQRAALAAGDIGVAAPVEVAKFQAGLPDDLAFVHFQVARADLLALVVDRRELRFLRVGPAAEAERQAIAWRRLLATTESAAAEAERASAAALGTRLLAGIAPFLEGRRRVWIAADGTLATIPFQALLVGSPAHRLVEQFEIGYAPSATVVAALRQRRAAQQPGRGLLALGDPEYPAAGGQPLLAALRDHGDLHRLPYSGEEVEHLAKLLEAAQPAAPRTLLLRADATWPRLSAALANADHRLQLVHFACHGFFEPRWGALSGLVLGGGDVLNASELGRMRLPADLLVLSACATAAGREESGEGVFGLVRGGFLAGCDRIVVSHWQVADTGTRDFMAAFYGAHVREGSSPAAALAAASRACLRAGGDGARPCHWAAFVLFGVFD